MRVRIGRLPDIATGIGIVAATLALSACQPNEDPAQAGFFSGAANIVGGTYDKRVQQKQTELSKTEQLRQQLEQSARRAQEEQQQTTSDLNAWEARVTQMDAELDNLKKQVAAAKHRRGVADQKVVEAQKRLEVVAAERRQLASNSLPSTAEQARYQRQMRAAREAVRLVSQAE